VTEVHRYNSAVDSVRPIDEQFVSELDVILTWAAQNGVERFTRFHLYRRNIDWLRANDDEADRPRIYAQLSREGRLTEILSTMAETIELVEVIPALWQHDVEVPGELLSRAFSGPVVMFQEDASSNKARNAVFELSMAAMAARAGLKPSLNNGNPDVSFSFENRFIKMECKRVLSENKILGRLREGIKQLEKSVRSDLSDVGLVAISLAKLLNPGDRILVSDDPYKALSAEIFKTLHANEQSLGTMYRPGVTGAIFYLSSAGYIPGKGFSLMRSGTVFPLNLNEQSFLRRLASTLRI
jgi:hypothetical protein